MGERQYNWAHCSLIGSSCVASAHIKRIVLSDSATADTKKLCFQIMYDLERLENILRTERQELDGTITHMVP